MTENEEVIIEVKNLKKVYRIGSEKVIALNNIDLKIYRGEICCILGTSGSGKSTLLNMMAGLEKPTRGQILIKNQAIEKMNEKRLAQFRQSHIGFIFQSYNLLPALTALENVALPLVFRGIARKRRDRVAKKYLEMVGLGARSKHKPTQMSGGQQQRVGIARAFVGGPEIIFADEPTGNLDTKTSTEVMNIMWKMSREKTQTIVIVTHDPEIAVYADKIIHIRDGVIQSIEVTPDNDVYESRILPFEKAKMDDAAKAEAVSEETKDKNTSIAVKASNEGE